MPHDSGVSAIAALMIAVGVMIFIASVGSALGVSAALSIIGVLIVFLGWVFL